jgi:hypothetical protein
VYTYSTADHSWHNGSSRKIKDDIRPNEVDVRKMLDEVKIVALKEKRGLQDEAERGITQ